MTAKNRRGGGYCDVRGGQPLRSAGRTFEGPTGALAEAGDGRRKRETLPALLELLDTVRRGPDRGQVIAAFRGDLARVR